MIEFFPCHFSKTFQIQSFCITFYNLYSNTTTFWIFHDLSKPWKSIHISGWQCVEMNKDRVCKGSLKIASAQGMKSEGYLKNAWRCVHVVCIPHINKFLTRDILSSIYILYQNLEICVKDLSGRVHLYWHFPKIIPREKL